jgi:hypothetical protein
MPGKTLRSAFLGIKSQVKPSIGISSQVKPSGHLYLASHAKSKAFTGLAVFYFLSVVDCYLLGVGFGCWSVSVSGGYFWFVVGYRVLE